MPFDAGLRLEHGGKGIAHPGYQQAHRPLSNDMGVDENQVGVPGIEAVFLENALVCVNDRQGAAGRIARSDGRAVNGRQIEVGCGRPRGVEHLAAAGADHDAGLRFAGRRLDPLDFPVRTFSAERSHTELDSRVAESPGPDLREQALGRAAGQNQRRTP